MMFLFFLFINKVLNKLGWSRKVQKSMELLDIQFLTPSLLPQKIGHNLYIDVYIRLGTVHLRRRQMFTIFEPYPRSKICQICWWIVVKNVGKFLTPLPLKNVDVINGCSFMRFGTCLLRLIPIEKEKPSCPWCYQ